MSITNKLCFWLGIDCLPGSSTPTPANPLTGEDSEWRDVSDYAGEPDGYMFQNKRASNVIKYASGYAFDLNRYIIVEDDCPITTSDCACAVEFPYVPKTTIVKRPSLEYLVFKVYRFFNLEY